MSKLIATETQEQIALIEWANTHTMRPTFNFSDPKITKREDIVITPRIGDYLFHIPNQGKRSLRLGYEFTKLGLKKGMPDLMFAYPYADIKYIQVNGVDLPIYGTKDSYHGLFIEMKRRAKSVIAPAQKKMMQLFESVGYKCVVAYGWEEDRDAILEYLG